MAKKKSARKHLSQKKKGSLGSTIPFHQKKDTKHHSAASSSVLIDLNASSKMENSGINPSYFNSIKGESPQDSSSLLENLRSYLPIVFFSLLILILDQVTKNLVLKHMHPAQSIPLIEGVLHLTYAQNTGAAFSLFTNANTLLSIISCFIIGGIIYWMLQTPKEERRILFALGVLLSGAFGNLTDRLLLGYVVDFIDIRVWPIFNIADIAISLSLLLLVVQLWKK